MKSRRSTDFMILFAFCLLVAGCADTIGPRPGSGLRVMLIGVDGATWDVMAPLIDGRSPEAAKTVIPQNLIPDGGFETSSDTGGRMAAWTTVEAAHSGKKAVLVVDDSPERAEFWQTTLDVEGLEGDRLLVEGWLRHPGGHGTATVEVRGSALYCPPRSFDIGPDWRPFSFQTLIPPNRSRLNLVIRPHRIRSPEKIHPETGRVLVDDLSVREVRRTRFPSAGFTHRQLDGPENRLPAISRLIREGASGPLGTFAPNLSPSLWTTAVTGKPPEDHGILGFYFNSPGREEPALVNSTVRRVRALWNIIGHGGDDNVAFVGWWVTWPAEAVNGVMVSDHANTASRKILAASGYLKQEDLEQYAGDRGLTYPHQLMSEVLPLMVPPASVTAEMVNEYANLTPSDRQRLGSIQRMEREELSLLKFMLAAHLGKEEVALHLHRTRSPRMFGVYFNIVDAIEHYFWRWMEPGLFPHAPEDGVAEYGETLERIYTLQDRTIRRLRELADDETVIIIISDHGHRPVRLDSKDGKSGGHSKFDPGVIIISGGPTRAGGVIKGATLLDITPTVLYLLGYPVARDMPGRVITEAIEEEYLAAHPIEQIETYEGEAREVERVFASDEDEKIGEELRALGYIE